MEVVAAAVLGIKIKKDDYERLMFDVMKFKYRYANVQQCTATNRTLAFYILVYNIGKSSSANLDYIASSSCSSV